MTTFRNALFHTYETVSTVLIAEKWTFVVILTLLGTLSLTLYRIDITIAFNPLLMVAGRHDNRHFDSTKLTLLMAYKGACMEFLGTLLLAWVNAQYLSRILVTVHLLSMLTLWHYSGHTLLTLAEYITKPFARMAFRTQFGALFLTHIIVVLWVCVMTFLYTNMATFQTINAVLLAATFRRMLNEIFGYLRDEVDFWVIATVKQQSFP